MNAALAMILLALLASGLLSSCGGRAPAPATPGARSSAPWVNSERLPPGLGAHPPATASSSATAAPPSVEPTPPPGTTPSFLALDLLGAGERVSALGAAHIGERVILAWATYAASPDAAAQPPPPPEPKGKRPRRRVMPAAKVFSRLLDRSLEPLAAPVQLSDSARSVGGVAVASGVENKGEVCVAWVESDQGETQIGLALVGVDGRVYARRVLTGIRPGASDVALARSGDGWVVAWVDLREPQAQIFASRVGRDLKIAQPERRLSHGDGEPSDVQIVARGERALVAWATARKDGADVFATMLEGRDLAPSHEARIASTPGLVHAVRVDADDRRATVGWIEAPPASPTGRSQGGRAMSPVVRVASFDWSRRAAEPAETIGGSEGASSLALGCQAGQSRLVLGRSEEGSASLEFRGVAWRAGMSRPTSSSLTVLTGLAPEDTSSILVGDAVLFAEDNLQGEGRLRRLTIAWPR